PILYLQSYRDLPYLHSFPTRRSSDLILNALFDLVKKAQKYDMLAMNALGVLGKHAFKFSDPEVNRMMIDFRSYLLNLLNTSNPPDRKSTRLNSSHDQISYAVFCLKKK